ncbi:MAG: hypothetical protein N2254_08935 [bacterium]|nr:hypothetical protein [bacterium]
MNLFSYFINLFSLSVKIFIFLSLFSCAQKSEKKNKINLLVPQQLGNISEFFKNIRISNLQVKSCEDALSCIDEKSVNIYVQKIDCSECYVIQDKQKYFLVQGGDPAGIIYGVAHILEALGFRFPHPFFFVKPNEFDENSVRKNLKLDSRFEPTVPLRGFQLHTLHPIEALFSFHDPGNFEEAKQIINWVILNRGNFVQYVPLGDIRKSETRYETWKDVNEKILEYSHKYGVKVGLNLQIFAQSSLQNAYLLIEEKDYDRILNLPFDVINLSFGEFVGEDPDTFVQEVNKAYDKIKSKKENIEITATVHVGDFEDLWLEYRGERLMYYFLVKFVNPDIIPLIHTVMYYNLFDSAGGAYNHKDFKEHRDFLFDLMKQGRKVGYKPETAYWVAFDNPVPLYLPIYLVSRWLDIYEIFRQAGDSIRNFYTHVIFSSGWEWGYWLYDYASLRISYYPAPPTFSDILYEFFAPAKNGDKIAELVSKFGSVQYKYLIGNELAAYLAGEDFYVGIACDTKVIISQPCRISFKELKQSTERQSFLKNLEDLEKFESEMKEILDSISGVKTEGDWQRILDEIKDGMSITYLRAKFIRNLYLGIIKGDHAKYLSEAQSILDEAQKIVERRFQGFFYPNPSILVEDLDNPTIYKFGYLKQAHTLCLWKRDIEKFKEAIGQNHNIPTCIN